MRRIITAIVTILSLLGLAACASAPGQPARASHSAPHPTMTASANVQTCQDYAKQMLWLKENKATLTLVDLATFGAWLVMDASNSTGRLHADLTRISAAFQRVLDGHAPTSRAGALGPAIRNDCSALGVTVIKVGR